LQHLPDSSREKNNLARGYETNRNFTSKWNLSYFPQFLATGGSLRARWGPRIGAPATPLPAATTDIATNSRRLAYCAQDRSLSKARAPAQKPCPSARVTAQASTYTTFTHLAHERIANVWLLALGAALQMSPARAAFCAAWLRSHYSVRPNSPESRTILRTTTRTGHFPRRVASVLPVSGTGAIPTVVTRT
jgi:hypothetical protein